MRGAFDDDQLEPVESRRDTELTLGSGTLLAAFFGLVLLCGLCFGLGYAVGHHGSQDSSREAQPASAQPMEASGSVAKPSATVQAAQRPTDAQQPAQENPGAAPEAVAPGIPVTGQPIGQAPTATGQPQTRPALAPAAVVTQTGQSATAASVHPAFAPSAQLMVQIAAVSNPEDADVLTAALRKRGYAVTVRRDPGDNLIHVRIGPFATQAEASNWRMKLLNDGYNAIVQ